MPSMQYGDKSVLIRQKRFVGLDGVKKSPIDLSLAYCGIQHCSPLHNNGPEVRNTSFIHIVLDGHGTLWMDGQEYRLGAHDAFVIPGGKRAQYTADRDDPWYYIWVGITGLMATESFLMAGFSPHFPIRKVGNVETLLADVQGIIDAYELSNANEFKRYSYLYKFFADLIEDYSEQGGNNSVDGNQTYLHAHQAYGHIMNHFAEPLKIGDLAKSLGVSRNYLFTCFKKTYGISPKQFLNKVRMEHATSLLRMNHLSIDRISASVGFEDSLAFSKAFKQHFGVCPSVYRTINAT